MPGPVSLTYNGVDLCMGTFEFIRMRTVGSPDGTTTLYRHFHLRLKAVFSPGSTAAPDPGRPDAFLMAPGTHEAIRQRLMERRKPLTVVIGNTTFLDSPQTTTLGVRLPCDANSGPVPIDVTVQKVVGIRTFFVTFEVETWLVECVGDFVLTTQGGMTLPPPTTLFHGWEASEDISEDFLSTRTITGQIIFRRDFLEQRKGPGGRPLRADDFRNQFIPDAPEGFQRTRVRVTATSDGTGLNYTVVDEQRPWSVHAAHPTILRICGSQTYGWDTTQVGEGISVSLDLAKTVASVVKSLSNASKVETILLEVWGRPRCTTRSLVLALLKAYLSMKDSTGQAMNAINPILAVPKQRVSLHVVAPARYARLEITAVRSGAVGFFTLFRDACREGLNFANAPSASFLEDFGEVAGPAVRRSHSLPNGPARADELVGLFTAALKGECDPVPLPAGPDVKDPPADDSPGYGLRV